MLLRTPLACLALVVSSAAPPEPAATARGAEDATALVGGTVHTMLPGEAPRVATVLIEGEVVVAVGTDLELPAGCVRVDVSGKHVVPALIDGYVNFDTQHDLLYTLAGIGAVRDVGGDHVTLTHAKAPGARARALGPHLLTAGAVLDGDPPSSGSAVILRSPEMVDELVPILVDEGVDFLSIMPGLPADIHARIVAFAHEQTLDVWGPLLPALTLEQCAASGQDGLHFLDGLRPTTVGWEIVQPSAFRSAGQLLVDADMPLVPMMRASAVHLEDQATWPDVSSVLALLSPDYSVWWQNELNVRARALNAEAVERGTRMLQKRAAALKVLFDVGVRLIPGSGAAQPWLLPGRALHRELELWQAAGIPAADVLRAATYEAARSFGLDGQYGTIQSGAVASLIVANTDPSVDVRALTDIDRIVVRGRVLEGADLDDLLATVVATQDEKREAFNSVEEVQPPSVPADAVVVLSGLARTTSFGLRMRTERFVVARLVDGSLSFAGRVRYSPHVDGPREMLISQTLRDGKLQAAEILLKRGDVALRMECGWYANSWRMRRTAGKELLATESAPERPFVVDAGSVTTLLVLGQVDVRDRFPILTLHSGLEPEMANWALELDGAGQHQVRTHVGRLAFRFDQVGAPEIGLELIGQRVIETKLVESDAFGGPGVPLPVSKRRAIEERRAAAADAAAEAAARVDAGEPSDAQEPAESDGQDGG